MFSVNVMLVMMMNHAPNCVVAMATVVAMAHVNVKLDTRETTAGTLTAQV